MDQPSSDRGLVWVCARNAAPYVERCVRSLAAQQRRKRLRPIGVPVSAGGGGEDCRCQIGGVQRSGVEERHPAVARHRLQGGVGACVAFSACTVVDVLERRDWGKFLFRSGIEDPATGAFLAYLWLKHGTPRGVGTPYLRRISLA